MAHSSDGFDPRPAVAGFTERFPRRTGPLPFETAPPPPQAPVDRADPAGLLALHEAGRRATELYSGPVGELVARELHSVAEFGFRFAHDTLTRRLVEHLLGPDAGRSGPVGGPPVPGDGVRDAGRSRHRAHPADVRVPRFQEFHSRA
ncbi:hypothetical protein [Pseudonocardia endophytica]|uniref:Uncharacterized protein n=1 Tax=Pseudonocardia endophytica TaxID=401976 RepID=A0A4V2PJ89_PSEEN|nr:hypothetical protein [Pseudonocardia endophytica]TCK27566.1 hypothetical protein EV378_3438 [Pseudonocardia endophytica]